MAAFLLTLNSPDHKRPRLGVLDTEHGFRFVQGEGPLPPEMDPPEYRRMVVFDHHVFITTPRSIRVYRVDAKDNFRFILANEYTYYDWYLATGAPPNTGLIPIHVSAKRGAIFVGNNSLSAVDEMTLKGEFVRRHSLWDISQDIFQKPKYPRLSFTYGQIRNICETETGDIYLTVANCNNSNAGKVIHFDSGNSLLEGLDYPQGGLASQGLFYLLNNHKKDHGKILAYRVNEKPVTAFKEPAWETTPDLRGGCEGKIRLSGMTIAGDRLYCSATCAGNTTTEGAGRIVSFDMVTGRQIDSFDLPDTDGFSQPKIFSIVTVPQEWLSTLTGDTAFSIRDWKEGKDVLPQNSGRKGPDKVAPSIKSTGLQETSELVPSIITENVSLCYRRTANFFSFDPKKRASMDHWALKNIHGTIYENDTVGLVGRNGSGKSTFSMLVSGALKPDKGTITTHGRVHLLALGIGFRPTLSGRDNVMINGTILGMTRREVKARMDEIEEFAELGDFFDEPIRTYSAGMRSRLGFAVSTAVEPDILILDEVMSAGDAAFRAKANKRLATMRKGTKTVVIVSHNPDQIKDICSRVLWLEKGQLVMDGNPAEILPIYEDFCKNPVQWLANNPSVADLPEDSISS